MTNPVRPLSGFAYVAQGWRLMMRPGLRAFVILPLLANIVVMGGALWWLFSQFGGWIAWLMDKVPGWLQWLDYLIWPVAVISVLLIFSYFFSTIANIIASPFNGWLSEKLEAELTGRPAPGSGLGGSDK